jgi:hypothetical protein
MLSTVPDTVSVKLLSLLGRCSQSLVNLLSFCKLQRIGAVFVVPFCEALDLFGLMIINLVSFHHRVGSSQEKCAPYSLLEQIDRHKMIRSQSFTAEKLCNILFVCLFCVRGCFFTDTGNAPCFRIQNFTLQKKRRILF